jgi:ribosomal protein L14
MNVADNSGAKQAYIVGIPGRGNMKIAHLGDVVTAVVKRLILLDKLKKVRLCTLL